MNAWEKLEDRFCRALGFQTPDEKRRGGYIFAIAVAVLTAIYAGFAAYAMYGITQLPRDLWTIVTYWPVWAVVGGTIAFMAMLDYLDD